MPSRILYAGQTVSIVSATGATRYFPIQSVNNEVTNPVEDVLSFGHLGSLGRYQNAVSTTKSDIKTWIPLSSGSGSVGDPSRINYLDAEFIQLLTGDALAGNATVVTVYPDGFTMSGILTNLAIDIANGQFATASMSFAGLGQPVYQGTPSGTSYGEQANMPNSFTPVNSSYVSGSVSTGCAQSFKFSLDLPTDQLACLGGIITGYQGNIANSFLLVSKPPFKASISVEGTSVSVPSPATGLTFTVGYLNLELPAGKVTSKSFAQSVGAVGATYSYTLEDVSALFSDNYNNPYPY